MVILNNNAPSSLGENMPTQGENLGVVVGTIEKNLSDAEKALAKRIIARAFMLLWDAVAVYLDHDLGPNELDDASIDDAVQIRAGVTGSAVQLAETLANNGHISTLSTKMLPAELGERAEPESVHGLIVLMYFHWCREMPVVEMSDDAWEIFLEAVKTAMEGHPTHDASVKLAQMAQLQHDSWQYRIGYYARNVAPELQRWHRGLGDFDLPRL